LLYKNTIRSIKYDIFHSRFSLLQWENIGVVRTEWMRVEADEKIERIINTED